MTIALLAAAAMLLQDIASVLLTQAEARDRAVLAGSLDTVGWIVALLTLNWSLTAMDGHSLREKVLVIGSVSVANFAGSWSGTKIGKRLVKDKTVAARLSRLEAMLADGDRRS